MYSAHIIMYFDEGNTSQTEFFIFENIVVFCCDSIDEALLKSKQYGLDEQNYNSDSDTTYDGKPVKLMFSGVRKIVACDSTQPESCINNNFQYSGGIEVSYSNYIAMSRNDLSLFSSGGIVILECLE